MNCPLCGFDGYYEGIHLAECRNRTCKRYAKRAEELWQAEQDKNRVDTQPMVHNPNDWRLFVEGKPTWEWYAKYTSLEACLANNEDAAHAWATNPSMWLRVVRQQRVPAHPKILLLLAAGVSAAVLADAARDIVEERGW